MFKTMHIELPKIIHCYLNEKATKEEQRIVYII